MATLDNAVWFGVGGFAEDGSTVITAGSNSTTVTGTFTANAWDASQSGYAVSDFGAFGVSSPIVANFQFSNPVENLSFDFQHVNSSGTTYDDSWTIYAYDEDGILIPAADVIAGLTGLVDEIVITNPDGSVTIDANGSTANNVTLLLPGKVSELNLVFQNGPGGTLSGGSGISDFTFDVPPEPDFIVEGTAAGELIDSAYVGDPEGDKVDNNDAADGSNDDSIDAGAGADTVYASAGNDTVIAGDGDDSVYGNDGHDSLVGGLGNDSLYGELGDDFVSGGVGDDHLEGNEGNDTLFGGDGNDWMRGSFGDDELWGGTGDDYLWGGFGDDVFHIENGFGNDTIDAEGVDEVKGDTLDLSLVTDNLTIDLTGANNEAGTFTDGVSTASFDEIENIILGGGQDTIVLADLGGSDTVSAFEAPTDNGDGTFSGNDLLDVSALTSDFGTTPVTVDDVTVTDDGNGNAVLTFPGGENLTLIGVSPASVNSDAALNAMGIPLPGAPVYDAIRLSGLPGDTDLLSAGSEMLSIEEPLSFAVATAGEVNIGDTTVIGGVPYTVTAVHNYEADLTSHQNTVTETISGHILELDDGAGGTVTLMLLDDAFLDKPTITEAQLIFVDPAVGGASIVAYDDNQNVSLLPPNYVVDGTAGADLINTGYVGDPEGDMIDAGDNLAGNNDDVVHAGDGADSIDAGLGNDLILGEGGDDEIFLDVVLQNDTIIGGETGEVIGDRINFSTIADDITITFSGAEAGTISDGVNTTTFSEIERFQMGTGNDSVIGSDGAEEIIGNFGNDTIIAGGGNDTIYSGFDNDSVLGGAGDDSLVTSSGADTVGGGAGDDQIDLGAADGDVDIVIFADGDGNDVVSAFEGPIDNGDGTFTGRDQLDVSNLHDTMGNLVNTNDVVVSDDGSGNAVLTFPGTESIILVGIAPAALSNPLALAAMGIPLPASDGIVSGTAADDFIGTAYAGDPDGDVVDGGDAELPGEFGDDDIIEAGDGRDSVYAGLGNDEVYGGIGDDQLFGESGNDALYGESGNDTLYGGSGDDLLDGGAGDDLLDISAGNDTLLGGDGSDVFVINDGFASATVVGGEGGSNLDTLQISATGPITVNFTGDKSGTVTDGAGNIVTFSEIERIFLPGSADNVSLVGDSAGIEIWAGDGTDTITGGSGNDSVLGQGGDDLIAGGTGDDHLDGDAGSDTVSGGDGNDTLVGDLGNDSLTGGIGADEVYGNEGNDTISFAEGDTVYGMDGDDTFYVTDLGEAGSIAGAIIGGEGNETLGDTLDFQGLTHWDNVTYTNTDPGVGGGLSGQAILADGSIVTFSEIENIIICFTAGTRIATPNGPRAVQDLRPGDLVITRDHGLQPVRWTGSRRVPASGSLAPVRFETGILGNDRPLLVSPQHRMLVRGPQASLMFGESEVLASAKHLVNGASVTTAPGGDVTYVHILFDAHEIVYAEGTPTESFFPGDTGLEAVDEEAREELFTIFPELRSSSGEYGETARLCLRAHESRLLRLG